MLSPSQHPGIVPVFGKQCWITAVFHDFSISHHDNIIGIAADLWLSGHQNNRSLRHGKESIKNPTRHGTFDLAGRAIKNDHFSR